MLSAAEGVGSLAYLPIKAWRTIVAAAALQLLAWGGEGVGFGVCMMQSVDEADSPVEMTRLNFRGESFWKSGKLHCNS
jgi:hypothetical protein